MNNTLTPQQKRENFKNRMIAQGKLPKTESTPKDVVSNETYSIFESWKHYNKQGHGKV